MVVVMMTMRTMVVVTITTDVFDNNAEQQQHRPDQINVADVLKSCNSSIRAVNKFLSGTKTIKTFVGSNGHYAVLVPYIGATF